MTRTETEEYLRAQMTRAGRPLEEIFRGEAPQAVYRATDGVPRLVNQVCDHALVLAYCAGRPTIEAATIEEAWADLQQLPSPWSRDKAQSPSAAVIEFGGLAEEPETQCAEAASADLSAEFPIDPLVPSPIEADSGADDDPLAQIDHIEAALEDLAGDYRPQGSAPEVEIVFEDTGSPFGEEFEHEELVVDRYLAMLRQQRPEPIDAVAPARPSPTVEVLTKRVEPARAARLAAEPARQTVPMHRVAMAAPFVDGDEIVIEELDESNEAPRGRRVVAVRPREYRQLFARLRSG